MVKYAHSQIKINHPYEKGFTMLETLLSFATFLIVVSFFPMLMGLLSVNINNVSYETDLFFEHLRMEIVDAKKLEVSGNMLVLTMSDGRKVTFEKFESNIRRRVNGLGNEILIQGINQVSYHLVNHGVTISITQGSITSKKRLSMAPIFF